MARTRENKLTISAKPIPKKPGRCLLHGYIDGVKIRQYGQAAELEKVKIELESGAREKAAAELNSERAQATWLTADQLRDCEAAMRRLGNLPHTILDCVIAAEKVLVSGAPVRAVDALDSWLKNSADMGRFDATRKNVSTRVRAFLAQTNVEFLAEISPAQVKAYVLPPGAMLYTKRNNGAALQAWLNYCVKEKWLKVSPMEIDLSQLNKQAKRELTERRLSRREGKTSHLAPAPCEKLLQASATVDGGSMLAYLIIALWCFTRNAEAQRVKLTDIHFGEKTTVDIWPHKEGVQFRSVIVPPNVAPLLRLAVQHLQQRRKKALPTLEAELAALAVDSAEAKAIQKKIDALEYIPFSRTHWEEIREQAGIIKQRWAISSSGQRYKKIQKSIWYENILRHTGESYCAKIHPMAYVVEQAGHSLSTAHRHYIERLPHEDAVKFFSITLAPAELRADKVA